MSKTTNKFSPEVNARAVRMILDHQGDYQRWFGSFEQARAIVKWSVCRFHAAARSGWLK